MSNRTSGAGRLGATPTYGPIGWARAASSTRSWPTASATSTSSSATGRMGPRRRPLRISVRCPNSAGGPSRPTSRRRCPTRLGPGLAVTGRTVDPEGRPVAGVRLLGLSWVGDELAVTQRHLGLSGPDGRFSLTVFTKGSASLRTDGGDLEYSEGLDLEGSLDLGSIVLRTAETYWIRVVDAIRGTPVPGARAVFGGGEGATTDREGMAQVSPRFSRDLMVAAKGYRTARFAFSGGASTRDEPQIPGLAALPVDLAGDSRRASTPSVGGIRCGPSGPSDGAPRRSR